MTTELKFVHIGMGNMVCANRIIAMMRPDSASGRAMLTDAKKRKRYLDARFAHALKTLIVMEDGTVVGSAITAKTLAKRCNAKPESNVVLEFEKEDEVPAEEPVQEEAPDPEENVEVE